MLSSSLKATADFSDPGFLPKVSSNINDFINMLGFPLTKAVLLLGMFFLVLSDKLAGALFTKMRARCREATRDGLDSEASSGGAQFAVSKSEGTT